MLPPRLQIYFQSRVTLIFCTVAQWEFTVIFSCEVWLKFVAQFSRHLAERDFCYLFWPQM